MIWFLFFVAIAFFIILEVKMYFAQEYRMAEGIDPIIFGLFALMLLLFCK